MTFIVYYTCIVYSGGSVRRIIHMGIWNKMVRVGQVRGSVLGCTTLKINQETCWTGDQYKLGWLETHASGLWQKECPVCWTLRRWWSQPWLLSLIPWRTTVSDSNDLGKGRLSSWLRRKWEIRRRAVRMDRFLEQRFSVKGKRGTEVGLGGSSVELLFRGN